MLSSPRLNHSWLVGNPVYGSGGARKDASPCNPLGIAGGLNVYAYANNNPFSFFDPSGLDPKKVDDLVKDFSRLFEELAKLGKLLHQKSDGQWGENEVSVAFEEEYGDVLVRGCRIILDPTNDINKSMKSKIRLDRVADLGDAVLGEALQLSTLGLKSGLISDLAETIEQFHWKEIRLECLFCC